MQICKNSKKLKMFSYLNKLEKHYLSNKIEIIKF